MLVLYTKDNYISRYLLAINISMYNTTKKIIAIRSINSFHLPPPIIKANWNLGKRCNYDCSYCSPHYHDAVSPHITIEYAKQVVDLINAHGKDTGKKIDWWLTGGEPLLNPRIIDILTYIKNSETCGETFGLSTNASLPLKIIEPALQLISNMSISIHTEQEERKINDTIANMLYLKQKYPSKFINASIIYLPNTLEQVTNIRKKLQAGGIKTIVRRVKPVNDGTFNNTNIILPHTHRRDKSLRDIPSNVQGNAKQKFKFFVDDNLIKWYSEYYSESELAMLQQEQMLSDYPNLGLWYEDLSYTKANSDDILTTTTNRFYGWTCFSGTDTVSIEFSGDVFNSLCSSFKIGNVNTGITWPVGPVICPKQFCSGSPDIVVRKCKSDEFLHLIDGSTELRANEW